MSQLEIEVANLTTSVNELLVAVNVKKSELDGNVTTSTTNAATATTKAAEASASAATAGDAATTAVTAQNNAVAVAYNGEGSLVPGAGKIPVADADGRIENGWLEAGDFPTIRPTLNLDFANSKQVDPRITFTRASTATYTDEQGLLRTAAANTPRIDHDPITGECKGLLIEEQRVNLLTYSENFDNAAWTKTRATITPNVIVAPDGTLTADKLVEDTSTGVRAIRRDISGTTTNTPYTISVFYGKNSERNLSILIGRADLTIAGRAVINPSGVVIQQAVSGATTITTNVESLVDYYRVSVSISGIDQTLLRFDFRTVTNNDPFQTYQGDGTSGIYIWGAQLEVGVFPTSYIPSNVSFTSRASTATYIGSDGLIKTADIDEARYQYNPNNLTVDPFLLLEPQRTNLLRYSEQFDNAAWSKTRATITADAAIAPDGTMTADKLVEDTTADSTHLVSTSEITTIANTPYTWSVYLKAAGRTVVGFMWRWDNTFGQRITAQINLLTGETDGNAIGGSDGTFLGMTSQYVGNDIYRIAFSSSHPTATVFRMWTLLQVGFTAGQATSTLQTSYTGDGTSGIYIWGAQLEESSYPTSYIPTVASQVTRSADLSTSSQTTRVADSALIDGVRFEKFYNQSEGTIYAEFARSTPVPSGQFSSVADFTDGITSNRILLGYINATTTSLLVNKDGVSQVAIYPTIATLSRVVACSYKTDDFAISRAGLEVSTDNAGDLPLVNKLNIGTNGVGTSSLNGTIKRLTYYAKRLTNDQLQTLTRS